MPRLGAAALVLALSWGCGPEAGSVRPGEPETAASALADGGPAYRPVTNALQTMEWILDPAADVIWDSAGFIITAEGETDLQPTTDEGWDRVRDSAALLAEAGNLLMMPGRAAGPDWVAWSARLTEAGVSALAAAEAHDADALFQAGADLYQACRGCHEQYMVPLEEARSTP